MTLFADASAYHRYSPDMEGKERKVRALMWSTTSNFTAYFAGDT